MTILPNRDVFALKMRICFTQNLNIAKKQPPWEAICFTQTIKGAFSGGEIPMSLSLHYYKSLAESGNHMIA